MNRACARIWMIIGVTGLILAGCSGAGGTAPEKTADPTPAVQEESTAEAKPLTELYAEIEENVELPGMLVLNDNYIANYFGIELEGLEEYIFTNAEEVIYADTVILMRAKPGTDKEALKEALNTMIEHKKAELENYLPEQFKLVEKSQVRESGDYIWLVISEKAGEIETIIGQYIE